MAWNHRILKKKCPIMGDIYYEIHEAYYMFNKHKQYEKTGVCPKKPSACIQNAAKPYGESLEDLKLGIEQMLTAFTLPIIDTTKDKYTEESLMEELKEALNGVSGAIIRYSKSHNINYDKLEYDLQVEFRATLNKFLDKLYKIRDDSKKKKTKKRN